MAKNKRSPALATPGSGNGDLAGGSISPTNIPLPSSLQRGRLIDRYGHEHSEAIFRNWTPSAIRALDIRRVGGGTTFADWLATVSVTSGPAGDLIADMLTDDRLPGFRSLGHMRAYLKRRSACCGAMQAASAVWRRYRRWRQHQALELAAQSLLNT